MLFDGMRNLAGTLLVVAAAVGGCRGNYPPVQLIVKRHSNDSLVAIATLRLG